MPSRRQQPWAGRWTPKGNAQISTIASISVSLFSEVCRRRKISSSPGKAGSPPWNGSVVFDGQVLHATHIVKELIERRGQMDY